MPELRAPARQPSGGHAQPVSGLRPRAHGARWPLPLVDGRAGTGRDDAMMTLELPWPARILHPNARPHWRALAHAKRAARADAFILARAAGWHMETLPEGRLHLWMDFYAPDRRRRDDDGLLASMKAARDGIADALAIDDARFVSHPMIRDEVCRGGKVVVRLTGGAV